MKTKMVAGSVKADGENSEKGVFTGYCSVFGNKDSYGEVVMKGAFEDALSQREAFPVYWSHQMSNPMMNIGKTIEIYEDDHGLFVKAQLDLETEMGAQVHRLIKDGRVNQMSFAFDVEDYAFAESDELGAHVELRKLNLHEVSVVQVGANQETELLDVKDRLVRAKEGRSISKTNAEKLTEAQRLITEVLGEEDQSDDGEKTAVTDEKTSAGNPPAGEKSRTVSPDAALAELYISIERGLL